MIHALRRYVIVIAYAVAFAGKALSQPNGWVIGEEREHKPGYYATYMGSLEGWDLWATENKYGRSCKVVKPISGGESPAPFVGSFFYSNDPFAQISAFAGKTTSNVEIAGDPRLAKEYRLIGDRFFVRYDYTTADWEIYDGQKVEFHLSG